MSPWYARNNIRVDLRSAAAVCHDRQEVTFYRNKSAYNLYRHSATQPVASARNTEKITAQARNVIADLTEHLGSQAGGAKVEQIYLKMDIEGGE